MFGYFINCSNSPHQVFCEDSPTKGLYVIFFQSDDLALHSRSQLHLKLDKIMCYNSYISNNIYAMASKLGMMVDLCMAYILMLISMTLTLMQGHGGLAKAKIQC